MSQSDSGWTIQRGLRSKLSRRGVRAAKTPLRLRCNSPPHRLTQPTRVSARANRQRRGNLSRLRHDSQAEKRVVWCQCHASMGSWHSHGGPVHPRINERRDNELCTILSLAKDQHHSASAIASGSSVRPWLSTPSSGRSSPARSSNKEMSCRVERPTRSIANSSSV
jgi:hypothetical protein